MKVFLIVRWPVGGIRTFIKYVYSSWPKENIQLHFLAPDIEELSVLKAQLKHMHCTWHTVTPNQLDFKALALRAFDIARQEKFDIIHAHGFTSALAIAWALPFLKIRSIFTSHDVLNNNQFVGIKGFLKKILVPVALNRFSVIHSVSFDAQQNLLDTLPLTKRKKCRVILNGVDTERFSCAQAAPLRAELVIAENVKLIGFFGRFMSQKGFKYLIEAMEQLEKRFPGKYCVACFGSGGFIREERNVIDSLGLTETFFFRDFVADTAPYVKACDLVVMPSLWEACPLVPMEVLAAGTPLVASKCIGLREVCADTPAIMVEAADSNALVEGILKVKDISIVEAGRYAEQAKHRFSIEKTRQEIGQLYRELAE